MKRVSFSSVVADDISKPLDKVHEFLNRAPDFRLLRAVVHSFPLKHFVVNNEKRRFIVFMSLMKLENNGDLTFNGSLEGKTTKYT